MKDYPSQWIASGLTCRNIADRATDYVDERLPMRTKVRVGLHVASCAGCRAYVKQLSLVRDATALLPRPLPSPINRLRLRQHFAHFHNSLE